MYIITIINQFENEIKSTVNRFIRNIAGMIKDRMFTFSDHLEGAGGGLVIASSSGKVAVNNTFSGRISRMRKDLVFRVAAMLFEGETR